MKGSYRVIVENNRLRYDFVIERNITVIKDYSGTGKSTLIRMLEDSEKRGSTAVKCERRCVAFSRVNDFWEENLPRYSNTILFFDEKCDCIMTKEFSKIVENSNCYFVLVTRRSIGTLPYSIQSVFRITEMNRYTNLKRENIFYGRYVNSNINLSVQKIDLVIVEDSNSGYEFFSKIFPDKCISAHGNGNVKNVLLGVENSNCKNVLVIVDGASFGAHIDGILMICEKLKHQGIIVDILAWESFEYILLKSSFLYRRYKNSIDGYENNIESSKFFSWEKYFTWLLEELTKGTIAEYSKSSLNKYYLSNRCISSVMEELNIVD